MKIYFERTGGFMGLRMVASFDTKDLPEEEAATIRELLDEVDFFELPSHLESQTPGMDQFHYVLSVSTTHITLSRAESRHEDSTEDRRPSYLPEESETENQLATEPEPRFHTVEFSDAAAPLEMLPLVRMLTRMARGQ